MAKKQPSRPPMRTILERIDVEVRAHGNALAAQGNTLAAQGNALAAQGNALAAQGKALAELHVKVDSQGLLLEDMRSQNRATIEAVEATRQALEQRIERIDQDARARDAMLEVAIRDLKVGVQQNSLDIRDLAGRVESLSRIEERVAAIERRLS
jgi:hypothetical protein